uniref:Uncharacterized protein n=1 Tax=Romanomermis culicivorax TaxID=13658 RepID=A0A915LAW7_ROMCU
MQICRDAENLIFPLERKAKGPGAPLADAKRRKTFIGILQISASSTVPKAKFRCEKILWFLSPTIGDSWQQLMTVANSQDL